MSGPRDSPVATGAGEDVSVLDALDQLAFGLVAMTSRAIAEATGGELTFQQWRILVVLGTAPAGLRVSNLGARIAASGPSTSRLSQRLARRGLVEMSPDQRDRRAVVVRLTHEGQTLRTTIVDRRRELIREAVGDPAAGAAPGWFLRLVADVTATA